MFSECSTCTTLYIFYGEVSQLRGSNYLLERLCDGAQEKEERKERGEEERGEEEEEE